MREGLPISFRLTALDLIPASDVPLERRPHNGGYGGRCQVRDLERGVTGAELSGEDRHVPRQSNRLLCPEHHCTICGHAGHNSRTCKSRRWRGRAASQGGSK